MQQKLQAVAIFSDNMVLQYGKPVSVWGMGAEGATVKAVWKGGSGTVSVLARVKNGGWKLTLPPFAPDLKGELIIGDGTSELCFRNLITGDVWFAGGQSNMEMGIIDCQNGAAELAACANPNIRFFHAVKRAVIDDDFLKEESQHAWQKCSPDTAAMLSAAAYYFARKIHADTGIPIGIINCNWGGTSICSWMSREQLARSRAGQQYLDDNAALSGDNSPHYPGNLHTSMVRRLAPFAMKGFLYYQGESDESRADDYCEMMCYLVDQWRDDWGDDDLPFLFVQLPMFASHEDMEDGLLSKAWCVLRECQNRASLRIAKAGMAVIIDCGEYGNIHPFDKQTVGYRLALQALKKVYGKDIEADGPVFSWAEHEGGSLRLHFNHAGNGLEFRGEPAGFEIAAGEGPYYPAQAQINGNDVLIRSDKVEEPQRARYAWIKFGPVPLFAKNGLPAMPFRTCCKDD
jgi:sialate O-acetylesterase